MTQEQEQLNEALGRKFKAPLQCEIATVTEVDETKLSCTIKLADGTEIPDVRLKASIDEDMHDGLVQIPVTDSSVVVGLIGNDLGTRFIVLFTAVSKVVFFGGTKELVIWEGKLKPELDKVKTMLEHIMNVINGTTINEPGSGAPSALQIALNAAIGGDNVPSFEGLTDEKILH